MDPQFASYCRLKDTHIYQSTSSYMEGAEDGKLIPKLYSIYHCVYDHYPYDEDVLEVKEETLATMKEAYRQMRIAEIYATRVDWMMSGDDSEETMQERLKKELADFEEEFANKDWSLSDEDD